MINFILCIFFHFKKERKRERGRKGERKEERDNQRHTHTNKAAPFFPGTAVATAYGPAWLGLDTQWALRKVLTEWGGARLPLRELPRDRKSQRGECTLFPGCWGHPWVWTGAKRERREVGELQRAGPREKRSGEGERDSSQGGAGRRTKVGAGG